MKYSNDIIGSTTEQLQSSQPLGTSANSESSIVDLPDLPDLPSLDQPETVDLARTESSVALPGSTSKKRRKRVLEDTDTVDHSQMGASNAFNQPKLGPEDVMHMPVTKDDPFAPEKLRLSQHFEALTPTRQLRTVVKVGKPSKESFVRVSTDPANWVDAFLIELKDPHEEVYWVLPALSQELRGEACFKLVKLALAVDRHGTPFIWRIGLPNSDGRRQPWTDSMIQIVELAKTEWVRVYWSPETRAFEARIAEGVSEPRWPDESMSELLRIAFKGRVIDSLNHPVIRQLRGQE